MRFDVYYYDAATGKRQDHCDLDVSQAYVDRYARTRGAFASVTDSDGGRFWLDEHGNVVEKPAVVGGNQKVTK